MRTLISLLICLSTLSVSSITAKSKTIAKLKVSVKSTQLDAIASVSYGSVMGSSNIRSVAVYEVVDGKKRAVPSQIDGDSNPQIMFLLSGVTELNSERNFIIEEGEAAKIGKLHTSVVKEEKDITMSRKGEKILSYRYATTYPPEGVDSNYRRSGYIHPLLSPEGMVLTRIQAPDHHHHYGIWGPWTKTHVEGREVDFWNLAKGLGRVKFNKLLSESKGSLFSNFIVEQQHIDYGAKGVDSIAINENLEVRSWNLSKGVYVVDYNTTITSPLENGILLDAYRYGGGIGFRANEIWSDNNSTVLTSEGKTRADADGTNARWSIIEGESPTKSGRSGILFMSHPLNRSHPEPMRIWPLGMNNGKANSFFEFSPIRHDEWKLAPNKSYKLEYRMVIFDGEMSAEVAEQYWQAFAGQVTVEIE